MKVVIVRDAREKTRQLISDQLPSDWKIVFVSEEKLINEIEDADAIIPEGAIINNRHLERAKKMKIIQTGAGYDNVDIEECTDRGIYVANAAGINAKAVAEHVFAFILCWYKNIAHLSESLKNGNYMVDYVGSELSEKSIGVVGLGNIGREVIRLASAFNMNIFGYHYRKTEAFYNSEYKIVDLQTLLSRSDTITLHVALNSKTRYIIGKKEFELMKNDAFFINTSRGGAVDELELIEALRKKQIGGAGLDVFEIEPLPKNSPLRRLKNVILSHHNAGEPDGLFFHKKRFRFFAENIIRVLDKKPPKNALNKPRSLRSERDRLIPPVILPDGYNGKILLMSISRTAGEKTVVLRSGDLWHREILHNTETEIRKQGLDTAQVHELGGARVRFESDGTIIIYGNSHEFGACDKEYAARLVRNAFPGRRVDVRK